MDPKELSKTAAKDFSDITALSLLDLQMAPGSKAQS